MTSISRRRNDGDETWNRLLEWTKGQKSAERLAGHILKSEGYASIDPSHPLGGKDGAKDILCIKDGVEWIGAAYFPRGQRTFTTVQKKFLTDLKGVEKNNVRGIAFVTNQELSLSERNKLMSANKNSKIEIFHLERIVHILNNPINYGIRLEFLDIMISPDEQLSYFAERDKIFMELSNKLDNLTNQLINHSHGEANPQEYDDEDEFIMENRTEQEILEAVEEFLDKIWYDRHMSLRYRVDHEGEKVHPEIWQGALESAQRILEKYGEEKVGPWTDFEWGMLNGKLSALRWVLGDEWDILDT